VTGPHFAAHSASSARRLAAIRRRLLGEYSTAPVLTPTFLAMRGRYSSAATATMAPVDPEHIVPRAYRLGRLTLDTAAWEQADSDKRKLGREVLLELEEARRRTPIAFYEAAGRRHHEFHLAARPRSIRLLAGGNRAGKTTTGVCDSLIQMTPPALVPDHLRAYKHHDCDHDGPYELRVVVPDMIRTGDPIKAKFKEWTPKDMLGKHGWATSWKDKDSRLTLECGCFMELLSTEMDLDKHGGTARHRIHFDEEPPEKYFVENMARLVDTGGDALFTMTPLKGLTWVFHQLWKNRSMPHITGMTIGMRHNKHLRPEDIEFVLSLITNEAERRQREFGEFAERGGPIYPNFMDAMAPHPDREHIGEREVVVGIDPGLRFAGLVWIAFDRDNNAFVFATVKIQRGDVDEYVRRIHAVNKAWGITRPDYLIDPASSAGNLVDGLSVMDALAMRGIFTIPANNSVEAGISEVRRRINMGALRMSDRLTTLQDEAIEYAAEDREDGVFKPVKGNDHLLDAMRYGLMYRPWLPPPEHRAVADGVDTQVATGPPRRHPAGSVMGWGA
jgi:phage terminase large subunit-like protein